MALLVQKYGGTSVANLERIQRVADRVAESRRQGNRLVVVVSAMSGVTDGLLRMAREIDREPREREMDLLLATGEQTTTALLAMALHARGVDAVALTGAQAGIVTDGTHTKARIANVTPSAVRAHLQAGRVVIVAGFQGQTMGGQITTLGRGGSDLTAIALAAVLKAARCEIYTDVDGVYTADPRTEPRARKIQEISYDEMLELASTGAKVMQARSVEFAKKFGVVFEVRSSFHRTRGTMVKEEAKSMERVVVRGVSLEKNQAKVTLAGVADRPGVAANMFSGIARGGINVDMIVQNVSLPADGKRGKAQTDITFTVPRDELGKVKRYLEKFRRTGGARQILFQEGIAKVSVVGIGMRSHSGVAAQLFRALAKAGVNIQMISTSEIKITVVVDESAGPKAVRAAHREFRLGGRARKR
ncbi:MAG: aspartate kinase [Verrucomicrobia bacterium]|nr:aspartate kinase [Verrucomicrobiota bacterium]